MQLMKHVLAAAEHETEAWEAAVSSCSASLLQLCPVARLAPSDGQFTVAVEPSHARLVSASLRV